MNLFTDFLLILNITYELRSCRINLTYSISVRFDFDVSGWNIWVWLEYSLYLTGLSNLLMRK
jgi:hypothetical protein